MLLLRIFIQKLIPNKMTLLNDNFFKYLAQTSDNPIGLKIQKADGCYITDTSGEKYLDLVAGFSVMNIGHNHPEIKKSIIEQASNYLHVMVYGEFILEKQVKYAQKIVSLLPPSLSNVYFVNSGAEAIEGALKLSKCYTHRSEIICFKNAYHGSTQGALSIMGNEQLKISFRPLIPDIKILEFNNLDIINQITDKTACVFIEPIQAEAGVQ